MVQYMIELLGDLRGKHFRSTIEEALRFIEQKVCAPEVDEEDERTRYQGPDIEDDRILVWEVQPNGNKKVVWHFSGWHWASYEDDPGDEAYGLEQGKLLGHEKTLYEELNDQLV